MILFETTAGGRFPRDKLHTAVYLTLQVHKSV